MEAGSDIVETNTFNGTSVAQSDYGMEKMVSVNYIRLCGGIRSGYHGVLCGGIRSGYHGVLCGGIRSGTTVCCVEGSGQGTTMCCVEGSGQGTTMCCVVHRSTG